MFTLKSVFQICIIHRNWNGSNVSNSSWAEKHPNSHSQTYTLYVVTCSRLLGEHQRLGYQFMWPLWLTWHGLSHYSLVLHLSCMYHAWLVACKVPSHHLYHYWHVVHWTSNLHWYYIEMTNKRNCIVWSPHTPGYDNNNAFWRGVASSKRLQFLYPV